MSVCSIAAVALHAAACLCAPVPSENVVAQLDGFHVGSAWPRVGYGPRPREFEEVIAFTRVRLSPDDQFWTCTRRRGGSLLLMPAD